MQMMKPQARAKQESRREYKFLEAYQHPAELGPKEKTKTLIKSYVSYWEKKSQRMSAPRKSCHWNSRMLRHPPGT